MSRTWVNPKLESRLSAIHGDGVFAREDIAAGERLMEFGGEFVSHDAAYSGRYRSRSVWMVGPDTYLALPKVDEEPSLDEHLNHSCDANAWLVDEVTASARRDIAAGEEVTFDQGTWNFDDASYTDDNMPCACGTALCRRVLTEHDWQLPDVQVRYRGHFHPMVQAMIDEHGKR